jgi:DNA-directed RNA polymerase subunit RPC12/RpoP
MLTEDKSSLPVLYRCKNCGKEEVGDTISETGSKNCQKCGSILSLCEPAQTESCTASVFVNKRVEASTFGK